MENALEKIQSDSHTKEIYAKLIDEITTLGKFDVEPKKTSLHISNGRAFLGVHPRSNGLLLNIVLDSPLTSGRVKKVEQVSKNRFHNEILVTKTEEIDSELLGFIAKAYSLTK